MSPNWLRGLTGGKTRAERFPGDVVWSRTLAVAFGGLFVFLLPAAFGGLSALGGWLQVAAAVFAWWSAISLLFIETRARLFWMAWLGLSVLILPLTIEMGWTSFPSGIMSLIFLIFRKYRPLGLLSSKRRALTGLIAFLSMLLVAGGVSARAGGLPGDIVQWAGNSVAFFWLFVFLGMILGTRLHFLRLKPKLAVVGLLFSSAVIFVVILVTLLSFFALGGIQASRGRGLFLEFAKNASQGEIPVERVFDTRFSASLAPDSLFVPGAPEWLPDFVSMLHTPLPDSMEMENNQGETIIVARNGQAGTLGGSAPYGYWASKDTTAFFAVGKEVWWMDLKGFGTDDPRLDGYLVNEKPLSYLSSLLHQDVNLVSNPGLSVEMNDSLVLRPDSTREAFSIRATYMPDDAPPDSLAKGFGWKPLANGFANLNVIHMSETNFRIDVLVMSFSMRLKAVMQDFSPDNNFFTSAIMISLGILGIFLLIIQIIAGTFGVRITAGVTSAVRKLHDGTKRLAEGDFDTQIDLPNEDEFGDLADSFNTMSSAVKRGREEAVARERLERELGLAREIQQRLLPHQMPKLPGFEVAGLSLPSRQVGGDYFDFIDLPDGQMGIAVADVSGKGIPAAMLMSNLQASLQGQLIHSNRAAEIVERMNELLVQATEPHMFATFFCGILERSTAKFTYTNAGHNPPMLCGADGSCRELQAGGLILGMLPMQSYGQEEVILAPGDVIALFTDGITEAASTEDFEPEEEEQFGEERLQEIVQAHRHQSAGEIKDAVMRAVADFTHGVSQSDDITLVVIKRVEG
jgi:serine phosphatase RsbU (regulator of sigma subunit)